MVAAGACVVVVAGLVYFVVLPASQYLVANSSEIAREFLTGCDQVRATILDNWFFARGRYAGDPRTARGIIGDEKQGKINQAFPSEWLDKTYDQIADAAKVGNDRAATAKKLLDRTEYDKHKK